MAIDYKDIPTHDLPDSLRELAELLGLGAAMTLVERWGGVRLHIPTCPRDDHPLVLHLGETAAEKLAHYYGGDRITVPRGRGLMRAVRDSAIRRLHDKGASASELALEFGLTERQVWNVLRKTAPTDKRQISLFPD